MTEPLVVDADGHTMEPGELWTDRMDHARWGDWIPRKVVEDDVYETMYTGGVVRGGGRELLDQMAAAVGMTAKEFFDLLQSLRVPGGYDPHARLVDMDADGIDAAVLYPSQALFFGPSDPIAALRDVEFVTDCLRAYNDWIAEYCAAAPSRLFGMAGVPLQDVDRAVAEAQRAVGDLGLQGVFIRPSAYLFDRDGRELPLNHSQYDPFWAACQELDAPIALHPGVHIDTPGACRKFRLVAESENMMVTNMAMDELHGGSGLGQAVGNTVDMVVTLGRLLMGGVCERFPRLRFLFLEAGGGWIPTQLERMDEQVEAFPLERRWLSMLPSEYFRRQCWAGFEAEEWNLAACAEFLGPDRVLWASDYPHPEYHPGIVDELRARLEPLDAAARSRVLGTNAVEAYGLAL
ncbi:MAG TPA: amidohydrolase family protein [Acidimicrobiia bacterium]|nr:amidohydrolase family protein [Acidimicrobiia bacterium]